MLLIIPFWVSYLMRMLAWIGLLLPDGLVNKTLTDVGVLSHPHPWLEGQASSVVLALIYGYVPYLILPLYATLDRIDRSVLEAGRDLGGSPIRTFFHVTLPLSRHGILAASVLIALPMFGDYYTNDVISQLAADDDDRQPDQPLHPGRHRQDRRRVARDRALGRPCGADVVLPLDHGASVGRRRRSRWRERAVRDWFANPWGQPRALGTITWLLHGVVDRAGRDRDPVLLQQRTLAKRVAGLLDPLVLGRSGQLGVPRPRAARAPSNRASGSRGSTC